MPRMTTRQAREAAGGKPVIVNVFKLHYQAKEVDVRALFERYGECLQVKVERDRATGRSKRYGFVKFGTMAEAEAAARGCNGQSILGKYIECSVEKGGSGPAGRGRGRGRGGSSGSRAGGYGGGRNYGGQSYGGYQ